MKKIMYLIAVSFFVAVLSVSCEKSDSESKDDPSNIPGMGNAGGELEVIAPFEMPEGLSVVGEITGDDASQFSVDKGNVNSQNSVKDGYVHLAGSGGEYIIIRMSLKNDTDQPIPYIVDKGTVFDCSDDGYQNGICAKEIIFQIPANSILSLRVLLYCVNRGALGSNSNVTYKRVGITSSSNIMKIMDALESKQINIDEFQDLTGYYLLRIKIQAIIWSCTNGGGLTFEYWEFINSLPEV